MKVSPSPERSGGSRPRKRSERGSALLIIFVLAAFAAIMLYRELPVFAFEAQRQKEQLLIDRGAQYKRGVKLFYKKFGMYPASIDQLENTNRLRFLRHRYKDPFTGKDDWRLLHMGPGGMLVDSKVNPLKANNQAGNASGFGTNSGFGSTPSSTANSGFGSNTNLSTSSAFGGGSRATTNSGFGSNTNTASNSGFGSNSSGFGSSSFGSSSFSSFDARGSGFGSNQGAVVVQPVPKRAPAVAANGRASTANAAGASAPGQTGLNRPDELAQAEQSAGAIQSGQQPGPGDGAQPNPNGTDQTGQPQPVQNNGQPGVSQIGAGAGAQGANSMNAIRQMLTNPNAQAQATATGAFRITSGGLAGVASKAQGHTIKVVNDQVDYSRWEFYYDPSKDVKQVLPRGAGTGAGPGTGTSTFNRTTNNTNRPTPNNPFTPRAAPVPAQPPANEFEPSPVPENPPEEFPNQGDTNPNDSNPSDSNPNDTPSEPPQ